MSFAKSTRRFSMPYKSVSDLPDPIKKHLPKHAQSIYKSAFNNAWEQYKKPSKRREGGSREATAHRVAWGAVKRQYRKGKNGNWKKAA